MALIKPNRTAATKKSAVKSSKATKAVDPVDQEEELVETEEQEQEEVETEEQEEVVETPKARTNQVATRTTGTAVTTPAGGHKSLEVELAEDGFEGMEVGYRSYITIKLPAEGIFTTSEEEEIGKSLLVTLQMSKRKYVYNRDDDDEQALFSYDQILTTTGESLEDALDVWKAEGATVTEKHYLDVLADVQDGDLEGESVMLSVPPASVQKLTGHMGKMRRKGLNPREVITEIYVMDKVKTKTGKVFYPWGFRLAQ
jgi:hypothetical protein